MFSCERCEKLYAYLHKLKHHKVWSCKGQPSKTCMFSCPRRAGSRNCFTLPPTPEKGEGDVEVGNGQKEGEEEGGVKEGGEGCELCFRVKAVKSSMLIYTN